MIFKIFKNIYKHQKQLFIKKECAKKISKEIELADRIEKISDLNESMGEMFQNFDLMKQAERVSILTRLGYSNAVLRYTKHLAKSRIRTKINRTTIRKRRWDIFHFSKTNTFASRY